MKTEKEKIKCAFSVDLEFGFTPDTPREKRDECIKQLLSNIPKAIHRAKAPPGTRDAIWLSRDTDKSIPEQTRPVDVKMRVTNFKL